MSSSLATLFLPLSYSLSLSELREDLFKPDYHLSGRWRAKKIQQVISFLAVFTGDALTPALTRLVFYFPPQSFGDTNMKWGAQIGTPLFWTCGFWLWKQLRRSVTWVSFGDSTPYLVSLRCGSTQQGVCARCLLRLIWWPLLFKPSNCLSLSLDHPPPQRNKKPPPKNLPPFSVHWLEENWSGNSS